MKYIILFLVSYFWLHSLEAQTDKKKFEKIFEQETSDPKYNTRENHSSAYLHTPSQTVPSWFINPPVSTTDAVYAIGISDPGMDTTQALETAIYRAQIIANVLYFSTTQLLCDFYVDEAQNTSDVVYEHFSRINAKLPHKADFEIIEKYRDKFDETLVLIKYHAQKKIKASKSNKINLEIYKNEVSSTAYDNFESVYEMLIKANSKNDPDPAIYQLTELVKRYDVLTSVNGDSINIPIYNLPYLGLTNPADSIGLCYFSHGLWKEYLKSIMVYIISKAREKPEKIQLLGEGFNNENSDGSSYEKLSRGISQNNMRFVLTHIEATKDNLNVTLQEIPLDE